MVTLQDRVKLVKSESDRLKEYLTGLPSDAWSRASACDAWQVRDVVGHLTWAAEGFADSISRGVGGDASAQAPFDFSPGTAKASSLAEHIAQCAIDHREALGDGLLAAFITSSDRLNQAFSELGPQDWDKQCGFLSWRRTPETFLLGRVPELAIHDWDIRSRFEPMAALSAGSLPALMERVPNFVGWSFHPGPSLSEPLRYRFELTGPGSTNKDVVVQGDVCRLEPAGDGPIIGPFRCDTSTFVLLMCGRLAAGAAFSEGRLAVESGRGLVEEFAGWFGGNQN